MNSIKLLHAADLHLDSAFEALPGALAAQRRQEQRQLLRALPALAKAQGAQLILLSGDLLDTDSPYGETVRMLSDAFAETDAHVFLAPGNHDYYSAAAPYARVQWPENVHVFTRARLEYVELPELGVRVWGAAFEGKSCPGLLHGFRLGRRDDLLEILCVHGEVGDPNSPYNPMTEAELSESGFDYAALGHVHTCSGLRRAGDTFYAWPGCAEGRGFDETGEKGVLLTTVSRGHAEAEFVPLGGRRYEKLTVDVTGRDPLAAVRTELPPGAAQHIFRITLTGECAHAPNLTQLRAALEGHVFAMQLRDETRLRRDLWAMAGEDTLRGLFLAALRQEYDAAETPEARELATMAARWGLAALDRDEEVFPL